MKIIKPDWKEKKSVLVQYGVKLISELELGLAMCDIYKFNQKELLLTFKDIMRRDITITVK